MKWTSERAASRQESVLLADDQRSFAVDVYNEINGFPQLTTPHPFADYSVTRLNPLYVEENGAFEKFLANDSSEFGSGSPSCCVEHSLFSSPLTESKLQFLKKNPEFVKSILVSLQLNQCPEAAAVNGKNGSGKKSHCASIDNNAGKPLTTIPEGKVPPRPVWPRDGDDFPARSGSGNAKNGRKSGRSADVGKMPSSRLSSCDVRISEILKELSISVNAAIDDTEAMDRPSEHVLQALRDKIAESVRVLSLLQQEEPVVGCGVPAVTAEDEVVATLSRAFSFVDSFKGRSHRPWSDENIDEAELQMGRLLLLKRLGRFPVVSPASNAEQPSKREKSTVSSSSSSSLTSTSGFSDLTHTPASSSLSPSESPSASRTTVANPLLGIAAQTNNLITAASNCDSNENTSNNGNSKKRRSDDQNSGNTNDSSNSDNSNNNNNNNNRSNDNNNDNNYRCAMTDRHKEQRCSFGLAGGNCQLIQNVDFLSTLLSHRVSDQLQLTLYNADQNVADTKKDTINHRQQTLTIKSDKLLSSYPGRRCPDFTLDVQQAEKLMERIKTSKKQKFWCKIITSFMAVVFLIFSVMFFSMCVSKGEKMFGSI